MSPSHSYSQHSAALPWLQRNCSWKEAQEMPVLMAFKVNWSQHYSPPSRAPCLSQPPQAVPCGGITSPRQEQDRSVCNAWSRSHQSMDFASYCWREIAPLTLIWSRISQSSFIFSSPISNGKNKQQQQPPNKPDQPKTQLKQKKTPTDRLKHWLPLMLPATHPPATSVSKHLPEKLPFVTPGQSLCRHTNHPALVLLWSLSWFLINPYTPEESSAAAAPFAS